MSKITIFQSGKDYREFIGPKLVKKLGFGNEGEVYTDGLDAYKDFYPENYVEALYREYYEHIITEEDISLSTFVLANELYVVRNQLSGIRTKLVKRNLFENWHHEACIENLRCMDFDKFIASFLQMVEDVKKLSEEKIAIVDLPGNMMFDGTNLFGIDTCYYHRAGLLERIGLAKRNDQQLRDAMKYYFGFLVNIYPELAKYFEDDSKEDIVKGIEKVKALIS